RRLPQPEVHGPFGRRSLHLVRAVLGVRLDHADDRHQPDVLRRDHRAVEPHRAAPENAAAGRGRARAGRAAAGTARDAGRDEAFRRSGRPAGNLGETAEPRLTREGRMTASDKVFAGSIPEIYDRLFVPLIFEPYANDIAARAAKLAPQDLLE